MLEQFVMQSSPLFSKIISYLQISIDQIDHLHNITITRERINKWVSEQVSVRVITMFNILSDQMDARTVIANAKKLDNIRMIQSPNEMIHTYSEEENN